MVLKQLQQQHNQFLEKFESTTKLLRRCVKIHEKRLITNQCSQSIPRQYCPDRKLVLSNSEIQVQISDQQRVVAMVTEQSRREMNLVEGLSVIAMIKASSVTLALGDDLKVSARNVLTGVLVNLDRGAVNADVTIELAGEKTLSAMITNKSADQLALAEGAVISALFKASSVILMLA